MARAGLLSATGTSGACDGSFSQDMNARWTAKPAQNPGAGTTAQIQLWYRDPQNTSNQTTSLSDAIEFFVTQQNSEQSRLVRTVPANETDFDVVNQRRLGPVQQ